jgi:2-polyprenyl-6-methoxyphenol hydroxylase-like FAD-dependent oxidoreductase
MSVLPESASSAFDMIAGVRPPADGPILLDTACVLGGSIAGLLAARVLSDYARRVVVIDRDVLPVGSASRPGTPHDKQVHTLLPAGGQWAERWFSGFTQEMRERGATVVESDRTDAIYDGRTQAKTGADYHLMLASRPFLEACIRARATALPNVSVLRARVRGLRYRDGGVSGVRYVRDGVEKLLAADFVVDAMGRSSRLADWLREDGFDQPGLERLEAPINYATAVFERSVKVADLPRAAALGLFSPQYPSGGVSVAAANAIEDEQWLVMLMGYGQARPGRTIDEFRAACARLPEIFGEAARGAATRNVVTFHQTESRRRHFTGLGHFPARLVSVGDAAASFNPVYGQGMSSAALHASCLSLYLRGDFDLDAVATEFFRSQAVVVDAAWMVSAGGDTARLDAERGTEAPEPVRQQRWALAQVMAASIVDSEVSRAFLNVAHMLRHPATLADPALLERALAVNGVTLNDQGDHR